MNRRTYVFLGFLVGVIASIFSLYVARVFSPFPTDYAEAIDLAEFVANRELGSFDTQKEFYIGSEFGAELIERLSNSHPQAKFKPLQVKPRDLECSIAPCGDDDQLGVDVRFPLWRVATANLSFFNGGRQLTLIKVGSQWKVIMESWWAI